MKPNKIVSTKNRQGYRNELTKFLDGYLLIDTGHPLCSNYIDDIPFGNRWGIRVPGATRGCVQVIDGKITEIILYKDSFCYKKEVLDDINKFIGREIDLGEHNE